MKTLKPNKPKVLGQIPSIRKFFIAASFTLVALSHVSIAVAQPTQKVESKDRDRGQIMLMKIKDELKKNYYDPTFHGMDLDTRF